MKSTVGLLLAGALMTAIPAQQPTTSARSSANNDAWFDPVEPLHLVGPIHYVGTRDLAAYLVATPQGHILIDGAMPTSAGLIEASIRKLGFKPEDIRILLTTQAHVDHVGTLAHFKKISGASVQAMAVEADLLASGGKLDYVFSNTPSFHYTPVVVDKLLKDGDTITLGGVTLTARHTPGHTRGCTTFLTSVEDGGRTYSVVFPGSLSVNPGTRLVKDPSYPGIADDYRRSMRLLESLRPDIFLPAHASVFNLEAKRTRAASDGAKAFVDPDGYRRWLENARAAFDTLIAAGV
jgi:metallo-beta-lactamase class B